SRRLPGEMRGPQLPSRSTEIGSTRRVLRAIAVYVLLVVGPVLLAVVLLAGGHTKSASSAKIVAGHPLAQLLLAVAVVVGLCKAAGWLAHRIGQPPVIGEIIAGIVLGPS